MARSLQFFKEGVIPEPSEQPADNTHELAKVIYNLVKVMCVVGKRKKKAMPEKVDAMIAEIKSINHDLGSRIAKYYREVTPAEVDFFMGNRQWYNDDGSLAIYHPQLDNPILMKVVNGEKPKTDHVGRQPIWAPRERRGQIVLPE